MMAEILTFFPGAEIKFLAAEMLFVAANVPLNTL